MANVIAPVVGSEIKIFVTLTDLGDYTMDDVDFKCEFKVKGKVTKLKNEMIRKDEGTYVATVDTGKLGAGKVTITSWVRIPDPDFGDGYRDEVVRLITDIQIYD